MAGTGIADDISKLKKEMKAVILAHNYQIGEVQDIADFVGDSLGLSRTASETDADVIVFCGVDFMAETAKVLSPEKTVLIPSKEASCPLAGMIKPEDVIGLRKKHPGSPVISYVNTAAAVKAECDICCTSSNLIAVAESFPNDEIIFIPDKHMANYLRSKVSKRIVQWTGYCPTHVKILPEHVRRLKNLHPKAKVLAHPECRLDVLSMADGIMSTGAMMTHAKSSDAKEFIIGTEIGILHRMRKENPKKAFYPASEHAICPNMKRITIHDVLSSLRNLEHKVEVPESTRKKAYLSIQKMIELA